jgi:peptide subunit release factor 1 (eRF1)
MMPSIKTTKETPKHHETVLPEDPRNGFVLNTVPEPGRFKQKVMIKDFYPPETVTTTSTSTATEVSLDALRMAFRSI